MRLAFCLFRYFPHSGLARDMLRIAYAAQKNGHQVTIFAGEWRGHCPPDMEVKVVGFRGFTSHGRAMNFARSMRKELRAFDCDGVVGFNKMPGLDVYFAGDGCFVARAAREHGKWVRITPRYRAFAALENAVFGLQADTHILLLSDGAGEEFRNCYHTPISRLHVLPPTLRRDAREGSDAVGERTRARFDLDSQDLMLLFVGSGFRTKGLDRALIAVATLPLELRNRCRLFVAGDDKTRPYRRLAHRLNIADRVEFLGPRDDIPTLMRSADLLVHPAHFETAGAVLLEAAVNGLPVLTTAACGYAPHIQKARAGVVLPDPFDQCQLNRALAEMLTAPSRRAQWSRHGVEYGNNESLYVMPETAARLVATLLARPRTEERKSTVTERFLHRPASGPRLFSVFDRRYDSPLLRRLLVEPDNVIDESVRLLKNDRTTTVALVEDECHRWVVKRYNNKNRWHAIRRTVKKSRARWCWSMAQRLQQAGIRTPNPVAMIEERLWVLRGRAYYVAEFVDGTLLPDHVRQPGAVSVAAAAMGQLFRALFAHRIKHGDMKASNLLMCGENVYVLDLDAARPVRSVAWMRRTYRRERARFMENWLHLKTVKEGFDRAIPPVEQLDSS